jgi:hypothetical protein
MFCPQSPQIVCMHVSDWMTNWTTWSRGLQELTVPQLVKQFIHTYIPWICVLQRQRDVEQVINTQNFTEHEGSYPSSQEPTTSPYPQHINPVYAPPHAISRILTSHLCVGFQSDLFPSGFLTKTLHVPLLYTCHMPCASHSSWFGHPTFCMDLRTNGDYFPIQHELTGFYNRDRECLLRGMSWVFKYRLFQGKSTFFGRTWDLRSFRNLCSIEW